MGVMLLGIAWGFFAFLVVPIVAFRANGRAKRLELEVAALRQRLDGSVAGTVKPTVPMATNFPAVSPKEPMESESTPASSDVGVLKTEAPRKSQASEPSFTGIEQKLASRWIVWVGTLAVILGGAFLVKHSMDNGWLGPVARISTAIVMGLLLVLVGEYLRRRPIERAIAAIRPNYVPPALAASGISIAFAAIYAAYGLFALVPGIVAAAGMAVVALLAVGLSVLHGPFLALIGLVGGYAMPILVASGDPSVMALFSYLTILTGACILVVWWMRWWWLAFCGIAGAGYWSASWMAFAWGSGDALILGPFLLAVMGGFMLFVGRDSEPGSQGVGIAGANFVSWTIAASGSILLFALVRVDAYGAASVASLAVAAVMFFGIASRNPRFEYLPVFSALSVVSLFAAWHVPELTRFAFGHFGVHWKLGEETSLTPYVIVGGLFATLFAIGGFGGLQREGRAALWAGLSTGVPAALFVISYWRITGFATDWSWAMAALALAAACVTAARAITRGHAGRSTEDALAIYAAAACAFLALAIAMTLREAWLTVALALEIPALAWIGGRLNTSLLRSVAAGLAGIVFCRLVLNWNIFDYASGTTAEFGWILYGYGVPAAAFFGAAIRFRVQRDDWLVALLEALGLLFAVLMVTLEIRALVAGSIDSSHYGFLEKGLQGAVWMVSACGLVFGYHRHRRPVLLYGGYGLAVLGGVHNFLGNTLAWNPIFTHEPVGTWPVFNLLLVAYAVPAAAMLALSWAFDRAGKRRRALSAALAGGVSAFAYVSLEIKHVFQGSVLRVPCISDAEFYAYSAIWLVCALGLLGTGIWRKSTFLRYASLALLIPTVAKVFLADMSGLTGLYRVVSFFGLGLSLIIIGLVYQRFVFLPKTVEDAGSEDRDGSTSG